VKLEGRWTFRLKGGSIQYHYLDLIHFDIYLFRISTLETEFSIIGLGGVRIKESMTQE